MLGDWFDFLRPVQTIWTPLQPSVIARTESKLCVSPQLKRYMHPHCCSDVASCGENQTAKDRKSTRLNSSHLVISYAVFCLKKKKKKPLVALLLDVVKENIAQQVARERRFFFF